MDSNNIKPKPCSIIVMLKFIGIPIIINIRRYLKKHICSKIVSRNNKIASLTTATRSTILNIKNDIQHIQFKTKDGTPLRYSKIQLQK